MSRTDVSDQVRVFGIRHHGPGSSKSLVAALQEYRPTRLLIEGAPEWADALEHLVSADTCPPVAIVIYSPDEPGKAVQYPFAEFSPEFQAMRWASDHGAEVRFSDLPGGVVLAREEEVESSDRTDHPLQQFAEAAGFSEVEDWWESFVEQRPEPGDIFEALELLMAEARRDEPPLTAQEAMREASMRLRLREALSEGCERIAVVCGAWHVPAVGPSSLKTHTAKADEALLKGVKKIKTATALVPWTYERLSSDSGYRAGTRSPAYFETLWNSDSHSATLNWILSLVRVLRAEGLDASPAHAVETLRLAEALAAIRGRNQPGLTETVEAARSVLVPDDTLWSLVETKLIRGEKIGAVPPSVPLLPLQADLAKEQKRLRMPPGSGEKRQELDLRSDLDLARSHLLHRLTLLGIDWGEKDLVRGKRGTFHEHWNLRWTPDLDLRLVLLGRLGGTVEAAASRKAAEAAASATVLAQVAELAEVVMSCRLPDALAKVVQQLQDLAATSSDAGSLADALPPLVAALRYGTVRRDEAEHLGPVTEAIFDRLCVGLPGGCHSLDDDAASEMGERLGRVTSTLMTLDDAERKEAWATALRKVATSPNCHHLVEGRALRLLFEMGEASGEDLAAALAFKSSTGAAASETAAFVEGLLAGPGAILLHLDPLYLAVDSWLTGLSGESFDELLPLIRRTFSLFTKAERRQIGEKASSRAQVTIEKAKTDEGRGARVMPYILKILGVEDE